MLQEIPVTLLVAAGALLLYALLSIIQSARGQSKSGCFSTLLMTVTLIAFLIAVIQRVNSGESLEGMTQAVALGIVGLAIGTGIVLFVLERRSDTVENMYSRGVFSITTGVIMLVTLLFTPVIPQTIFQVPSPTPIAVALNTSGTGGESPNIVPTDDLSAVATNTPQATLAPTITNTPLPLPSPTRTRRAFVPPTVTPTPQQVRVDEQCGATVTTNLNVREEDDVETEVVAIIPEGTYIGLDAKNLDGTWWQTEYQGERGWVASEFLSLDSACSVELSR